MERIADDAAALLDHLGLPRAVVVGPAADGCARPGAQEGRQAEAGGEDAYFGDPTAASVEEGEAHFTTLADILTLSIMEHLGSKA